MRDKPGCSTNDKLDELAALAEFWAKRRKLNLVPKSIKSAMLMVIREIQIKERAQTKGPEEFAFQIEHPRET